MAKIIFIRGVPGTGKTEIANVLKKELTNSEVIHVDKFKLEAMKKLTNSQKDIEKSREIAYEKTLKKLKDLYKKNKYIIVEEIICEKYFLNKLMEFVKTKNCEDYWFRIERKGKELLKEESKRDRLIKNTREDFLKLKRDLDTCKIPKEISIRNDDFNLAMKKILSIIID